MMILTIETSGSWWWIILAVAIVTGIRILAGRMDRQRIREEVANYGCRVVNITWTPFGFGWFGEDRERLYEICYETADGQIINATCKTSLFRGVFWKDNSPDFYRRPVTDEEKNVSIDYSEFQKDCPKCGRVAAEHARFCSYCGQRL